MQMILAEHFSCCLFCNPTASWGGSLVAMPVAPLSTHSRAWIDIQTRRHTLYAALVCGCTATAAPHWAENRRTGIGDTTVGTSRAGFVQVGSVQATHGMNFWGDSSGSLLSTGLGSDLQHLLVPTSTSRCLEGDTLSLKRASSPICLLMGDTHTMFSIICMGNQSQDWWLKGHAPLFSAKEIPRSPTHLPQVKGNLSAGV